MYYCVANWKEKENECTEQRAHWCARCVYSLLCALLQIAIVIAVNSICSDWFIIVYQCGQSMHVCVYNVYAKTESFSLYTKTATTYFRLFHLVPSNGRSMKTEPLDGVDSISRWILLTTTAICRVVHISFNLIKNFFTHLYSTHARTKNKTKIHNNTKIVY